MSIKKTKKSDIQFGKKDVFQNGDFESHRIGHRISIVIPEDVLMRFRKKAKEGGTKYQTLMNHTLRQAAFSTEAVGIENRLKRLEKTVFKKK